MVPVELWQCTAVLSATVSALAEGCVFSPENNGFLNIF